MPAKLAGIFLFLGICNLSQQFELINHPVLFNFKILTLSR